MTSNLRPWFSIRDSRTLVVQKGDPMTLNARPVTVKKVGGIWTSIFRGVDYKNYPEFTDAYFDDAVYSDTGEPLSVEECDRLREHYADILLEMCYDTMTE